MNTRGRVMNTALVLEQLPNGDYAWLRADDEPRSGSGANRTSVLTEKGRDLLARWRAEVALFGREVSA